MSNYAYNATYYCIRMPIMPWIIVQFTVISTWHLTPCTDVPKLCSWQSPDPLYCALYILYWAHLVLVANFEIKFSETKEFQIYVILDTLNFINIFLGYRKPFEIRFFTDSVDANTGESIGFCLKYTQLYCSSLRMWFWIYLKY